MAQLDDLRDVNVSRAKRWHPGFPEDSQWTIADWSNALCGEVGEAANIVKKVRRIDCNLKGRDSEIDRVKLIELLADELADVFIYLDLLAAAEEIDLWPIVVAKFNRTSVEHGFEERL